MDKLKTIGDLISSDGVFTDGDWIESKDQDPSGNIRLIQLADMGDGNFINKSNRFMTEAKAKKLNCTFLQEGDILVARMPDPIGRACIFPGLPQKAVTVVDVCIIRPNNPEVYPPFIKFLINNDIFRREINKHITGTTRKRISRKNLNKIEFNLPSFSEQKRIVKILDNCESLILKRRESIDLLNHFFKSSFHRLFGDPVLNTKKWKTKKLGELCEMKGGKAWKNEELTESGLKIVRISNLHKPNFPFWHHDGLLNEKYLITAGDLLFSWAGVQSSIDVYLYEGEDALLNQHIYNLIPKSSVVSKIFLYYALLLFLPKLRTGLGGGVGQFHLKKADIYNIEIILPDEKLAAQFEKIVEATNRSRTFMETSAFELTELFVSLGSKLFCSERIFDLDSGNQENHVDISKFDKVSTKDSVDKRNEGIWKNQHQVLNPQREKIDISKMTYLDFIGMPEELQMENYASDYSIETDFVEEELFWQFFLKGRYKKEPFDLDQVEADFNQYFIPKGKDFNYDTWKKHIYKFIEADPPIVDQYFDEKDNTVKLRLTDEAFKA